MENMKGLHVIMISYPKNEEISIERTSQLYILECVPYFMSNSLLTNGAFALRQRNGSPVYTQIREKREPYSESEICNITTDLNKKRKKYGLTLTSIFDRHSAEMLRELQKKIRTKNDYPLDLHKLERIIISPSAHGYISTAFLDFMREFNVPLYFINGRGMIDCCFMPTYFKKTSLIINQREARINRRNLEIAKFIIKLKIESEGMNHFLIDLNKAKNILDISVVESHASKIYFEERGLDIPARLSMAVKNSPLSAG